MQTPYHGAKKALLKNIEELLKIKEYPDTKTNSAMRIAVMNAEAVTIQALMALETREDTMLKEAGLSDSQLYKQAGNSVTVNVIYEIAKNRMIKKLSKGV